MKRLVIIALLAGAGAVAWYQAGTGPKPLAQLLPAGALLTLEAKDFSRLLTDWNSSAAKPDWLNGANYQEFERSNLFLKLNGVYKSYSSAAGFSPDMASLLSFAGDQSALALYDLQSVQFAYISRMPQAKAAQSRLWLARRSYESRQAASVTFYVNSVQQSTVAFAITNGYLLVSTGEERMAGMLGLLTGKDTPSIASEGWYRQSTNAAGEAGELRLAMNLENLVESSYFRSYWVQRNVSEVRRFLSGVADITRTASDLKERRVFMKRPGLVEELTSSEELAAAGTLSKLTPDGAGLSRVWAKPSRSDAVALLDGKLFRPRAQSDVEPRYAPVEEDSSSAGSEADLETRIDQPPLRPGSDPGPAAKILAQSDVLAILQVQSSKARPASPFVMLPCAVGLISNAAWDVQRIKDSIGGAWITQTHGAHTLYRADGLSPVTFSVDATLLLFANDTELLQGLVDRTPVPAGSPPNATYAAYFRHDRERSNYLRLMNALDFRQAQTSQQPVYFSGNLASLSSALSRVNGIEMTERTMADRVEQQVVYQLLQLR